jgi:hypothetical protein
MDDLLGIWVENDGGLWKLERGAVLVDVVVVLVALVVGVLEVSLGSAGHKSSTVLNLAG